MFIQATVQNVNLPAFGAKQTRKQKRANYPDEMRLLAHIATKDIQSIARSRKKFLGPEKDDINLTELVAIPTVNVNGSVKTFKALTYPVRKLLLACRTNDTSYRVGLIYNRFEDATIDTSGQKRLQPKLFFPRLEISRQAPDPEGKAVGIPSQFPDSHSVGYRVRLVNPHLTLGQKQPIIEFTSWPYKKASVDDVLFYGEPGHTDGFVMPKQDDVPRSIISMAPASSLYFDFSNRGYQPFRKLKNAIISLIDRVRPHFDTKYHADLAMLRDEIRRPFGPKR